MSQVSNHVNSDMSNKTIEIISLNKTKNKKTSANVYLSWNAFCRELNCSGINNKATEIKSRNHVEPLSFLDSAGFRGTCGRLTLMNSFLAPLH